MFIAGDGLGYYSYLPAKFIYHDHNYDFKWFNKAHNANYLYSAFENPEQNLLVEYGNKRINKYYQGLSYIWMPFFFVGHFVAKILHYPPDGFSPPYQYSIAFASVFYLLLGLIFLRKLIRKLFDDQLAALLVPVAIFYGTHLFNFAIFANSLSHAYSFTFLVLFLYFLAAYFKNETGHLLNFLFCMLFFVITCCIRPLNGLSIFLVPAFIPKGFFKQGLRFGKFSWKEVLILLLTLGAIYHQLSITYIQTGSFFAYTYTDEKFYFTRAVFTDALFSYHIGLFVYVPLFLLSFFGIPFLPLRHRIFLPLFFLFIVYLYSAWWYWPILKRAVIDFYALPAIFLGALIANCRQLKWKTFVIALVILTVVYYQFKEMQVRNGILDGYATHKELFWRNFFRMSKANFYSIPPSTILEETDFKQDFEGSNFTGKVSTVQQHSGKQSLSLGPENYICRIGEYPFPAIFKKEGFKKIRVSFYGYFTPGIKSVHAFLQFFDKNGKMLEEAPFYINEDYLEPNRWDYKEFGYEVADPAKLNSATVDKIVFAIWNVEANRPMYIDDARIEFILTDRSFETVK